MTRTTRKQIMKSRLDAMIARKKYARLHGEQSAVDLLRNEVERLKSLPVCGNHKWQETIARMQWAFTFASAWLESRNAPETIRRWKEIK